ncbi:TPA: excinuclease ABC subunit C [Bacillus pseudomycoides]|nr:excinuclease ABC subunit C [Bacillus pseudomycoides]
MEQTKLVIDDIRKQIKDLIQNNSHREVTFETNHKISGIYMLYIDHFTSDTIVPFYIGQTIDIQKRYGNHLKELMALNRISYEEYREYFFVHNSPYFNGSYKACKIFKYLIENQCTIQDLRMVILEEVDKPYLKEVEQEYFDRLVPAFLGFNQMNTIQEVNLLREVTDETISKFLHVLRKDLDNIFQYYKYGYSKFNYENCFPKSLAFIEKRKEELQGGSVSQYEKVKSDLEKLRNHFPADQPICDIEKCQEFIDAAEEAFERSEVAYKEAVLSLESRLIQKCEELEIYSTKTPINNFIKSIVTDEKVKFKNYFLRYMKSKECQLDFYDLFDEHIQLVEDALVDRNTKEEQIQIVKNAYDDCLLENSKQEYQLIFPSVPYTRFPLKDQLKGLDFKKSNEQSINTCELTFYISNDGVQRNYDIYTQPEILRMYYSYTNQEGKRIENEYYIENTFTTACQSGIRYILEGFYKYSQVNRFKLSSLVDGYFDNSFISLAAEYKHGMNDYTIQDKPLIPLENVFEEIQKVTDEKTTFRIYATESAKCLSYCMSENQKNHPFAEKLIKMKVKRIKR